MFFQIIFQTIFLIELHFIHINKLDMLKKFKLALLQTKCVTDKQLNIKYIS